MATRQVRAGARRRRKPFARRGRRRRRSGGALYRLAEHAVAGGALGVAALAVLGATELDGRPWLLGGVLVALAIAGVAAAVMLDRIRSRASTVGRAAIDAAALGALVLLVWTAPPERTLDRLSELVAAERGTQERVIRHQVYAAYRRMDLEAERRIVERAEVFAPTIERAAQAFAIDPELLFGIAAAESSFYPRDSRDGGRGLFQVTAVPPAARERAKVALGTSDLDSWNQLHNAYLAAATLAEYRAQMKDDLFLTLLAYNIGPQNGGLRTVMQQYGARNFAQIQPYLQPLPRDYPIRVLAGALAYRVWRRYGMLPRFEEAEGARLVQAAGVPGLDEVLVRADVPAARPAGAR